MIAGGRRRSRARADPRRRDALARDSTADERERVGVQALASIREAGRRDGCTSTTGARRALVEQGAEPARRRRRALRGAVRRRATRSSSSARTASCSRKGIAGAGHRRTSPAGRAASRPCTATALCSTSRVARLALMLALVVLAGSAASGAGSAPSAWRRRDRTPSGPTTSPGPRFAPRSGPAATCSRAASWRPGLAGLARARIEFWLVNEQGEYDAAHRATVFSRRNGSYRFESNRPVGYSGRRPHIHVRVSARGFRTLVTQHHPRASRQSATVNLVLVRR